MVRSTLKCACVLAMTAAAAAQQTPATCPAAASRPAVTQPATRPAGIAKFQSGVSIDWTHKRVLLDGEIVLREGPLELFACSPNTKEHESIVRVRVRPMHVFQALGLIGLEPGHPAYYSMKSKAVVPADGQRLQITVSWTADGRAHSVPIHQWMWNRKTDKPAGPVEWVFAGSVITEDDRLLADLDGTVITVVDFESAIIAIPAAHTAANEDLWLSAYTDKIPPAATPVTIAIEAAKAETSLRMDRFGRLYRGEQPSTLWRVLQAAQAAATDGASTAVVRHEPGAPAVQIQQLVQALRHAGLAEVVVEEQPAAETSGGQVIGPDGADPQPLAVLESLADLGRRLPVAAEELAQSLSRECRQLNERATHISTAAAGVARTLGSDSHVPPAVSTDP